MVRHIVSWNFKPELTEQQRKELAVQVVERLNALQGQIPGLVHHSGSLSSYGQQQL